MTSTIILDFLTPLPLVTVALTQLIFTLFCFWRTPLHTPSAHVIGTCPLNASAKERRRVEVKFCNLLQSFELIFKVGFKNRSISLQHIKL